MPKNPPSILNAVFYLFETAEDAKDGKNPGGTGFIVGWNKGRSLGGPYHFYAVTNWHVAVDESDADSPPYPVIRLNNKSGTTEIIDLRAKDWKSCQAIVGTMKATLIWNFSRFSSVCLASSFLKR